MVMQPENNLSVSKKLLNLDIIRAVAAIMIVLVHLELFGWGGHGVELFLLLTGYTAFLSIDRHKDITPLTYYKRRLARIIPRDRKSTRLNSSHRLESRMPSSA